jgi:hypothetical protein
MHALSFYKMQKWSMGLCVAILISQPFAAVSADSSGEDIISSIDLTKPFHAKGSWQFVVRGNGSDPESDDFPGPLHFCFVRNGEATCSETEQNYLVSSDVVYPTPTSDEPLLTVVANINRGGPGGCCTTFIWAYNAKADRFDQIFVRGSGHNNNGEVRVVTNGSLAGDIVISIPPRHAPYRYGIAVYRLEKSHYSEILNYEGKSRYDDGNPLPVIDAEMPQILSRLHLWTPGDVLPSPARTRCAKLEMRNQVEWCEK